MAESKSLLAALGGGGGAAGLSGRWRGRGDEGAAAASRSHKAGRGGNMKPPCRSCTRPQPHSCPAAAAAAVAVVTLNATTGAAAAVESAAAAVASYTFLLPPAIAAAATHSESDHLVWADASYPVV